MSSAVSVSFSGANWNHRSALDGVPPQRHCSDKLVDLSREPVAFCDVLAVALGHRVREGRVIWFARSGMWSGRSIANHPCPAARRSRLVDIGGKGAPRLTASGRGFPR